jgi:Na+/H+ antiporter NhaC
VIVNALHPATYMPTGMVARAGVEPRALRALRPLAVFIAVTVFEVLRVGWAGMQAAAPDVVFTAIFSLEGLGALLSESQSTRALLIGSGLGFATAVALALGAGLRSEIPRAAWNMLRSMGVAIVILYLAWMIGRVCGAIGTAPYLTALLGDRLPPAALPAALFILSALVALSTGSSWSTMSILLPLVVGLSFELGQTIELGGMALMVISIGATSAGVGT